MKLLLTFIVMITLFGCASKKNKISTDDFVFINGNEKITFEILTGNKYLEVNKITETRFKFENINPESVSLSGKTIRFLKGNAENELLIEMTPKREDLENGKLTVFLSYKSIEELKIFELRIPVKM